MSAKSADASSLFLKVLEKVNTSKLSKLSKDSFLGLPVLVGISFVGSNFAPALVYAFLIISIGIFYIIAL